MRLKLFSLGLLAIFHLSFALAQDTPAAWEAAEREIKRLPPTAFPQLPRNIVQALQARGCAIPQTYADPNPHNAIRGAFAKPGQQDWAVLCLVNGEETLLVFWAGSEKNVSEISRGRGATLQEYDPGKIGYSRAISLASKEFIENHYRLYGGSEPFTQPLPPIDHDGIDDAFIEKASSVHYFYQGKWIVLPGSD